MEYALLLIIILVMPTEAYAYIDPGSGSAIMSAIIGFFVVVGLTIKSFWYKITGLFTGKKSDKNDDSEGV